MVKLVAAETVASLFTTEMGTVVALAIDVAVIGAVNLAALTKVVVSGWPAQAIFAPETNPVPFTVSVKALPPAVAEAGLMLAMVAVGAVLGIVNQAGLEVRLLVVTLICATPGVASNDVGTGTEIEVGPT